jgi:hypothetical protein
MSLFKTITEVRKYVPSLDENMNLINLKPSIDDAEELFIKDLLGETFYDILLADYTDHTDAAGDNLVSGGMNADNLALLPFVQKPLANYAALFVMDQAGSSIGDVGIQESFGNNSRPAPRWKTKQKEDRFIASGDRFADNLLSFLEKKASPSKYNAWYSDIAANTAMAGCIVFSTKIASKYIDINNSRRIFLKLKLKIREIEQDDVQRVLCADQYDEIVTQIKTGSLTTANKNLLAVLEPFIAKKSLRETMPYIRIAITPEGLVMQSSTDGVVTKSAVADNVSSGNAPLKKLEMQLDKEIKAAKNKIDQFIIDNIDSYPLLKSSPCYTSKETTPPKYQATNNSRNKHFSI